MRRPKQPKGQSRGDVLRIRLLDHERAALDAAAQADGLETSTWARAVLLALADDWPRGTRPERMALARAYLEGEAWYVRAYLEDEEWYEREEVWKLIGEIWANLPAAG